MTVATVGGLLAILSTMILTGLYVLLANRLTPRAERRPHAKIPIGHPAAPGRDRPGARGRPGGGQNAAAIGMFVASSS